MMGVLYDKQSIFELDITAYCQHGVVEIVGCHWNHELI